MKRIVLISPYPDIYAYGLRMISACLKKEGFNTEIYFFPFDIIQGECDVAIKTCIEKIEGALFVGISLMSNYFNKSIYLTEKIKESLEIPILWGGIHPTIEPEECLKYADFICIGEGEYTVVELAKSLSNKEDWKQITGIWGKNNGSIFQNGVSRKVENIDSLPFQDFKTGNSYIATKSGLEKLDEKKIQRYIVELYMTICSRGCIYECTYCCNYVYSKLYDGNKVRRRSNSNILEEIDQIKSNFNFVKQFIFEDDVFLAAATESIREFCDLYKNRIGLPFWISGITPSTVKKEKLDLLVDAGLKGVRMGIQSGSEKTRKIIYGRGGTNSQIIKASQILHLYKDKIDIPTYDFILDNPWESEDNLIESLKLILELQRPFFLNLYSLTFYPGTQIYSKAVKEGIIKDKSSDLFERDYLAFRTTYLNCLFIFFSNFPIPKRVGLAMIHPFVRRFGIHLPFHFLFLKPITYILQRRVKGVILHNALRKIRSGKIKRLIEVFFKRIN